MGHAVCGQRSRASLSHAALHRRYACASCFRIYREYSFDEHSLRVAGTGIYSASKAALALLTKNAAQAHRFDRIRVNGINVGWTATPAEMKMQSETLGKGGEWLEAAERAQPFGRLIAPEDVAKLTLFLLSEASLPMTGSLIDQEQWVSGHAD